METRHMVTSSLMFPAFEQANHDVTGQAITMNQTQPWSLYTVIERLQDSHWYGEILSRLHQHFPNSPAFVEPELDWLEALHWLLKEMDQQWFPINWDMIDDCYVWSQQDPSMTSELMPCLWRALPIKQFGITLRDYTELHEVWHSNPSLCLMFMLTEPSLYWIGGEIPYDFGELDYFNTGLWLLDEALDYHQRFLDEPLEFGWLFEPLSSSESGMELVHYLRPPLEQWLPVVSKITRSGYLNNLFLHPTVDTDIYGHSSLYHWDCVERFRQQWQVAKPVIDQLKRFDDWITSSPDRTIQAIAKAQWGLSSVSNLALFTHILEKGMPLWKQEIW